GRGAGARQHTAGRLLLLRGDDAQPDRPPQRTPLPPRRPGARDRGARRSVAPPTGFPGGTDDLTASGICRERRRPATRHRGDPTMIQNDQELKVTRERISHFLDRLARLRVGSRPEELALVSGGYRAEVELMQREVLDYLTQPAPPSARAG